MARIVRRLSLAIATILTLTLIQPAQVASASPGVVYEGSALAGIVHSQKLETWDGESWQTYTGQAIYLWQKFRGSFTWSQPDGVDFQAGDSLKIAIDIPLDWAPFAALGDLPFGDGVTEIGLYHFEDGYLVAVFNDNVAGKQLESGYFSFEFHLLHRESDQDQRLVVAIETSPWEVTIIGTEPNPTPHSKGSDLQVEGGEFVRELGGYRIGNLIVINRTSEPDLGGIYYDIPSVAKASLEHVFDPESLWVVTYDPATNGGLAFNIAERELSSSPQHPFYWDPVTEQATHMSDQPSGWISFELDEQDLNGNDDRSEAIMIIDFSKLPEGMNGLTWFIGYSTVLKDRNEAELTLEDIIADGNLTVAENNLWLGKDDHLTGSEIWIVDQESVNTNGGVLISQTEGAIRLLKQDEDGDPLAGAVFELWTGSDVEALAPVGDAKTTGPSGVLIFDDLPELEDGFYWLVEFEAPEGYALPDDPRTRIDDFAVNQITELTLVNWLLADDEDPDDPGTEDPETEDPPPVPPVIETGGTAVPSGFARCLAFLARLLG